MGLNEMKQSDLDILLHKKFTSSFRKGYVYYGNIVMTQRFEEMKEKIDGFEVYDDDVWICSFPKTGTTWTQEMVWLICNDLDYKGAEENLGSRFPFLEVSSVFDFRDHKKNNIEFVPPPFLDDSLKFMENVQRSRFIKTHLPWSLLPKQIQNGARKPKIIYVTRNPKDTCVSYYHHAKLFEGFSGNFQEYIQLFIGGKVLFGPFWKNVMDYWDRRQEPNILFIKYEDMRRDLKAVVLQTAEFLGKSLGGQELEKLLHHLSFESMKNNRAVNFEPVLEFHRKFGLVRENGVFMRSGKSQSHKAEMNQEEIDAFDNWTLNEIKDTDYIV